MEIIKKRVLDHLKKVWETWDLRVVILFSLFLQTFLILSAPLRKRMSKAYISLPMWLAYLLADVTATYAVGLISKSQFDLGNNSGLFPNTDLLAFWAPFLLVHLGGPDTITAFALEDNELWLRHLLNLVFQCLAVAYAFFQSIPNKLWIPTMLMCFAGLIKYTERTRSLYLASSRRFRDSLLKEPDPGPNYAKLMDEYSSKIEAKLPTKIEMIPEPNRVIKTEEKGDRAPLKDLEVVQHAYGYFETFKGLIADLIFSFRERSESRNFFLKRSARDAFKVVEVELNFFYEILYTKVVVVQGKFGYPLRFLSFSLNWAALVYFYLLDKVNLNFKGFDIGITYTLLLGAIALDAVAFLMVLFSDWTAVALTKSDSWFKYLGKPLFVKRKRWPENSGMIMQIVHRRWSESLSQFNFIHYCLNPRQKTWGNIVDFFGLTKLFDGMKYVETVEFTDGLRDFIFEELKLKSEMADDLETAKEIFSARGDWVLRFEACTELLPWITEVDFDESLLLWHIATELCYSTDKISTDATIEGGNAKKSLPDTDEVSTDATTDDGNGKKSLSNTDEVSTDATTEDGNARKSLPNTDGVSMDATTEDGNAKKSLPNTDEDKGNNTEGGNAKKKESCRDLSKLLSDYMLYLLIMQGPMMSTVAGIGEIRFRDTSAEAQKFFRGRKIVKAKEEKNCCLNIFPVDKCFNCTKSEKGKQQSQGKTELREDSGQQNQSSKLQHEQSCTNIFCCSFMKCCCQGKTEPDPLHIAACNSILGVTTAVKPVAVKGDRSKSVLFDACILAKKLNELGEKRKWVIMSKVWVELMSYAACRCRAYTHAAQLSKGGQLITLVWLLMAHLGLGNQFQISEGHARAKLIVGK